MTHKLSDKNLVNELDTLTNLLARVDQEISDDDFRDWSNHRLTVLFFNWVLKKKTESENLIFLNADNIQTTYRNIGAIQAFEEIINKYKELK